MLGICVSIKHLKKRIQTKPIKCLKYIIVESMIYDSIFHTLYCCLLLLDLTTDGQVKPHNEDQKQTKEIHQVDQKWNGKMTNKDGRSSMDGNKHQFRTYWQKTGEVYIQKS